MKWRTLLRAGYSGLLESRHASMAKRRRLDDTGCERGSGSFSEAHSHIEKRLLAHLFQKLAMARLGGNMTEQAVIDGLRIGGIENRSSSACHETVDDDRNFFHARRENCACHGRDLAATETAQHLQQLGRA